LKPMSDKLSPVWIEVVVISLFRSQFPIFCPLSEPKQRISFKNLYPFAHSLMCRFVD
jgi:hypothetical protein